MWSGVGYTAASTASVVAALLAHGLAAQRTWGVDAADGPGTNLTDLPPAFAAAGAGDTVLVRAGAYSSASTSTPLRLLGGAGGVAGSNTAGIALSVSGRCGSPCPRRRGCAARRWPCRASSCRGRRRRC